MNITSENENCTLTGSGWYSSKEKAQISCQPPLGYLFESWSGTGNGAYSGQKNEAQVTPSGPIFEVAKLKEANMYTLRVLDDVREIDEVSLCYEDTWETLSAPDIYNISDNVRAKFDEWVSFTPAGYSGPDRNPVILIKENSFERAFWRIQYYVNSSDRALSGWYDEGTIISLPRTKEGIIPKFSSYFVNGLPSSDEFIYVTGPMELLVKHEYSLLHVLGYGMVFSMLTTLVFVRLLVTSFNDVRDKAREVLSAGNLVIDDFVKEFRLPKVVLHVILMELVEDEGYSLSSNKSIIYFK